MSNLLDNLTRRFILNEGIQKPSLLGYVESIIKIFEAIKPRTEREVKYHEMIKHYLRELRNGIKKLEAEKQELQEQVSMLEEEKSKRKSKKQ